MVTVRIDYAPTDEQAQAAVLAGRDAAMLGAPRDSVPHFDVDDARTRRLLKLCWVRGWSLTMQQRLQERYGTPPN